MMIRPTIAILIVLALVPTLPCAAADDEPAYTLPIPPDDDTCIDVNPYTMPPVYAYECPPQG